MADFRLWREEGFDENVGVGGAQIVIAEAARHSDGGQHSTAFAFAVDDGELQVVGRDRFVGPARHVRLTVEQSLTNVSTIGTSRVVQSRVFVA